MRIADSQWIPAAQHQVWDALNDSAVLQHCIPGCAQIERLSASEYAVTVQSKFAGQENCYHGELLIADIDAPNSFTLAFEGKGDAAGQFIGTAQVNLSTKDKGTRVAYTMAAQVGGKLCEIGEENTRTSAERIIESFFTAFIDHAYRLPRTAPPPEPEPERGVLASNWSWAALVGVIVALGTYHFFLK